MGSPSPGTRQHREHEHDNAPVPGIKRFWQKLGRTPVLIVDSIWAAVILACGLLSLWAEDTRVSDDQKTLWIYLLGASIALPLAYRRTYPFQVLALCSALALVFQVVVTPGDLELVQVFPLWVATYTLVVTRLQWKPILIGMAPLVPLLAALALTYDRDGGFSLQLILASNVGSFVICVAIGVAIGHRRANLAGIQERARLAELNREDEVRRLLSDERLHIARELHDVVAHSMATISVQASMASHVFETQPDQARNALVEIRKLSKDALQELRTTLIMLRPDQQDISTRAPAPGLWQIDSLIGRMTAAGLNISVVRSGDARPIPATVDLVAYRIVQEALTNVVRHAGKANVVIRLNFLPDRIGILIEDDGHGTNSLVLVKESDRLGLIGMRERAHSVGGVLSSGPAPGKGFLIEAMLPIGAVA